MSRQVENIQFIIYGLGPIGIEILKKCEVSLPGKVIGVVDIDPEKTGKDISSLIGGKKRGVKVVSSIKDIQVEENANCIAIHATGSNLVAVWPQFKEILDHNCSIVSTCEQLAYPWHRHPELAAEIHEYAKSKSLNIIGTGINPGYVMDTLVLSISSVVNNITSIKVDRHVDVKKRRLPLQQKVGVGMKEEEFKKLAKENKIGHVGLEESLRLIAAGLNLELTYVENTLVPTIADKPLSLNNSTIEVGEVNGQHQVAQGKTSDGTTIELNLIMSTSVKSEDRIVIDGDMKQELVVPNGIFGDSATASIIINTAKTLAFESQSGLLTMKDIRLTRNIHL